MDEIEKVPDPRITGEVTSNIEDTIVRKTPLTIVLDNQELVSLLCSPTNLKYLAVGFLFSEGLLKNKEEINKVTADDRRGVGGWKPKKVWSLLMSFCLSV